MAARKVIYATGCVLCLLLAPLNCIAAPFDLEGDFTQGGLVRGQVAPGSLVFLDGRKLRVSPQGTIVFGFGRDAAALSVLRVESPEGEVVDEVLRVRPREYMVQRIDGLDTRKVNPKPGDLERIRNESADIARARKRDDARVDFMEEFLWPVHGILTGVYGSQRILNGEPRRPHFGVDIACRAGGVVKAPAAGIVSFVHPDMFFSGKTLVIDHGHGVSSSFLHLESTLVPVGDRVGRGQPVATVGASGRVTGAHLDWRINWFGVRVDPALLAGEMPPPSPECRT